MKKLFSLMFVMLAIMMPMKLWAQEPYAVLTTDSATILSQDSTGVTYGKTLTFYYDDQKATRGGMSVGLFTNELHYSDLYCLLVLWMRKIDRYFWNR